MLEYSCYACSIDLILILQGTFYLNDRDWALKVTTVAFLVWNCPKNVTPLWPLNLPKLFYIRLVFFRSNPSNPEKWLCQTKPSLGHLSLFCLSSEPSNAGCWCNENLDILHFFQPMTSQLWFLTYNWFKLECGRQNISIVLSSAGALESLNRFKWPWLQKDKKHLILGGKFGNSGHSANFYGHVTNWQQQNSATKLVFSNCLVEKRFFTMLNRNWSKIKKV